MLMSAFRAFCASLALLLVLSAAVKADEKAVYEVTAYVQSGLKSAGFFEGDIDGRCSPEMVEAMRRYYGHAGRTEDELPLKCDLMVILYLSAFQHEFGPEPARQLGFDLFTQEEISFANSRCNLQRGLLSEVENTIQSAAIDNLVWLQGRFEARKDTLNELEKLTLVEIGCVVPLFENR